VVLDFNDVGITDVHLNFQLKPFLLSLHEEIMKAFQLFDDHDTR